MLVLVLGWTSSLPKGVDAPPAMLRGRTAGFPKRRDGIGEYNLHNVPPNCGTPTTSRLYPFGADNTAHPKYLVLNSYL